MLMVPKCDRQKWTNYGEANDEHIIDSIQSNNQKACIFFSVALPYNWYLYIVSSLLYDIRHLMMQMIVIAYMIKNKLQKMIVQSVFGHW